MISSECKTKEKENFRNQYHQFQLHLWSVALWKKKVCKLQGQIINNVKQKKNGDYHDYFYHKYFQTCFKQTLKN